VLATTLNYNSIVIHGPCRRFRGDQNDEDTRTFCGKFLYSAIATTDNVTAQHKNCPTSGIDDRPGRDLFRVLKRSPILNRTHLVFDEVIPMGRQWATRPDSDEDSAFIMPSAWPD